MSQELNLISRSRKKLSLERTLGALTIILGLACGPAQADDLDQVQALAERGRPEEALRRLEMMLVKSPRELEARFLRGVLLAELGRNDEAASAFHDLGTEFPDRPEPAHNLAVLQALRGRPATAMVALGDLVDRYPWYEAAARNLERIRRGAAGGEFDPLSGDSSRVPLVLTDRLGSFPLTGSPAEPAGAATPSSARPSAQGPPIAETPEVETKPARNEIPAVPELEVAPPEPFPSAVETTAEAADAEPGARAPASPPTRLVDPVPAEDLRTALGRVVLAWAEAWSEQRVRDYLAFYADDFLPTGFPSRESWESVRRQRVAAPRFIEVDIDLDSLTVLEHGTEAATVSFVQGYRSDRYNDSVRKRLRLVLRNGRWKIQAEESHEG